MRELADISCVPCSGEAPPLSEIEVRGLHHLVPEWQLFKQDGIQRLTRTFQFIVFKLALEFTKALGELADMESYHPVTLTEYLKTTVTWWTHVINGLHRNDFIMAARADRIFQDW